MNEELNGFLKERQIGPESKTTLNVAAKQS